MLLGRTFIKHHILEYQNNIINLKTLQNNLIEEIKDYTIKLILDLIILLVKISLDKRN